MLAQVVVELLRGDLVSDRGWMTIGLTDRQSRAQVVVDAMLLHIVLERRTDVDH